VPPKKKKKLGVIYEQNNALPAVDRLSPSDSIEACTAEGHELALSCTGVSCTASQTLINIQTLYAQG
jgi:hypothetical protein